MLIVGEVKAKNAFADLTLGYERARCHALSSSIKDKKSMAFRHAFFFDYDRNSAKISSHIPINDRWITNAIFELSPLNSVKTFTSYWEKSCSYTIKLFFIAYESSVQSLWMSVQSLWMSVQSLWMCVQSLWTENIQWFNEIFAVV